MPHMRRHDTFFRVKFTVLLVLAAACSPSATPTSASPADGRAGAGPSTPSDGDTVIAGPVTKPAAPVNVDDVCPAGKGKTYEVGEGKKYTSVSVVPWERLGAGDRVLIHARKEPYREKILLSQNGTAAQPIRVCGVRSADGARP